MLLYANIAIYEYYYIRILLYTNITIHLDYYSVEELMIAIQRNSEQLQVSVDENAQIEIGQRSRGTMRIAKNLLLSVRDFAVVRYDGKIDGAVAREALEFFQIDELGMEDFRDWRVPTKPYVAMLDLQHTHATGCHNRDLHGAVINGDEFNALLLASPQD